MNSGPVEPVQRFDASAGRWRRIGLRAIRSAILLIVVYCIWLIYPIAKIRLCLNRVESKYEPVFNPITGELDRIDRRGSGQLDTRRMAWEEDLANQPLPRLLDLLPSNDPVQ